MSFFFLLGVVLFGSLITKSLVMLEAKHKSRPSCSEALGLFLFGERVKSIFRCYPLKTLQIPHVLATSLL